MSEILTITASTMDSYRTSWSSASDEVIQGYYNNGTNNIWWGHFWFSDADLKTLRTTINNNVKVEKVELYFKRDNTAHGAASATPVKVYCSSITSASGTPSTSKLSDGVVIGSFDRGEGKWCALTTTQLNHLLGSGNGFCAYHNSVSSSASNYSYYVRSTVKPQLRVTYSYVASTGKLSATSVEAGAAATMTITPYSTAFSHKLVWTFGSNTSTQTVAAGTTSASYTIPLSWLSAIPSATSGKASVVLTTLQGTTQIGETYTYSFTITAPSSVVPTISTVTATRVDNGVPSAWATYVQGKSKATIAVSGAAGAYGSTIASYTISGGGYTGSASSFTTGVLESSGTVTFTATVRDSRGRSASKTVSVTVVAYSAPTFPSVTAFRSDSAGAANNDGTYIRLTASFSYASVSSLNTISCTAQYRKGSTGTLSSATTLTSGTGVTIGAGGISIDADYDVVLTLKDGIQTVTHIVNVPSAAYTVHFMKGGKGVAFGKASTLTNAVEVASGWAFYAGGKNLAALTPAMIGALATTGGTITGRMKFDAGHYIHRVSGTGGSAGYFRICSVLISGTYFNTPIEFSILQRGRTVSAKLSILFSNINDTDPTLNSISYTGECNGAYIQKSATSTWEVYVAKTESYDDLTVVTYDISEYIRGKCTITWRNDQVTTLPSGYVQASYNYSDMVVPVKNGGTGQTTVAAARNALGLGNTAGAVPIANGGTGATTVASALANLDIRYGRMTSVTVNKTGLNTFDITFSTARATTPQVVIVLGYGSATGMLQYWNYASDTYSTTGCKIYAYRSAQESGTGTIAFQYLAI